MTMETTEARGHDIAKAGTNPKVKVDQKRKRTQGEERKDKDPLCLPPLGTVDINDNGKPAKRPKQEDEGECKKVNHTTSDASSSTEGHKRSQERTP